MIPPMDSIPDPPERVDLDTEMLDVEADTPEEAGACVDDGDSQNHDRHPAAGFVMHGPGSGPPLPGNAQDDGSEGDGSRSASAEGAMAVIPDAERIISGKRKR